jgi:hypothetical protein
MSISSIGIQTILPLSGTAQQPPAPEQSNDSDSDSDSDNGRDDSTAVPVQAGTAPGTGKLVDRTV